MIYTNLHPSQEGIDFLIWFQDLACIPLKEMDHLHKVIDGILAERRALLKPIAIVVQTDSSPEQVTKVHSLLQKCVSSEVPFYYTFAGAANALSLVVSHYERRLRKA